MQSVSQIIDQTFRQESGQILATLIAMLGDFTLAEDALQDAIIAALQRWPVEGVPRNPPAWLTTVARRRAIDRLRQASTASRKQVLLELAAEQAQAAPHDVADADGAEIPDERLKLLFTCC